MRRLAVLMLMAGIVIGLPRLANLFRSERMPASRAAMSDQVADQRPPVVTMPTAPNGPVAVRWDTVKEQGSENASLKTGQQSDAQPRPKPRATESYLPPGINRETDSVVAEEKSRSAPQQNMAPVKSRKSPPRVTDETSVSSPPQSKTVAPESQRPSLASRDDDDDRVTVNRTRRKHKKKRRRSRDRDRVSVAAAGSSRSGGKRVGGGRLSSSLRNANFHWPGQ